MLGVSHQFLLGKEITGGVTERRLPELLGK